MKRVLDLDCMIDEQEHIMQEQFPDIYKKPTANLRFSIARMMKCYLLKEYAIQNGETFSGEWVDGKAGEKVCSICWMPMRISRCKDGKCSACGSENG